MTPNIDSLVEKLQAAYAARKDPLDLPHTLTQRQVNDYVAETARMATALSALRNIENDLAKPLAQIADLEEKRAATVAKQAELEAAIVEAPDWQSFADRRDRDREWVRQNGLKQQLDMLHQGRLLAAPGRVFWTVADLDARIAELNKRIEALRATHATHMQAAEALLASASLVSS